MLVAEIHLKENSLERSASGGSAAERPCYSFIRSRARVGAGVSSRVGRGQGREERAVGGEQAGVSHCLSRSSCLPWVRGIQRKWGLTTELKRTSHPIGVSTHWSGDASMRGPWSPDTLTTAIPAGSKLPGLEEEEETKTGHSGIKFVISRVRTQDRN